MTATVRQGDTCSTSRYDYIVGADGAHSAVRTSVGIDMVGPDNLGAYLAVLFRAPLADVVGERRYGLYMVQHQGPPSVFLPTDNRDRWVYSIPFDPSVESLADYPHERIVQLIRNAAGVELDPKILRVGEFAFAAQIAQCYREGRAFLVGDAAHRMTPRGGTGMNTAIHDGFDLGWKLAWTLRGWDNGEILDTYEAERRPVGLRNTQRSAAEQSNRDVSGDYLDDLGGRLPHAWLSDGVTSTLDLLGPGLTLLTGAKNEAWTEAAAAGSRVPIDVRMVDTGAAESLGIDADGAVLVRPDGRPVGRWLAAVDSAELAGAVRGITAGVVGHATAR